MIGATTAPTMKGSGDEGPRLCGASIAYASTDVLHPNGSPVPCLDARSHLDDWPPDHHQSLADCAPVCDGTSLLLSLGVFITPMVSLGAGSPVDHVSPGPCRPAGSRAASGR